MKKTNIALAAAFMTTCAAATEPAPSSEAASSKIKIYNIVILDQSGSMDSIKKEAMDGYNETVQTIQAAQKKHHATQQHYVSLVLFNSEGTQTVYDSVACDGAKQLTSETYQPNTGTPLFDAMGTTLNKFRYALNEKETHKVLITIITDGAENASQEYTGPAIKKLVEELQTKGWVFTYIGANQDVIKMAETISVRNTMQFAPSSAGTQQMFKSKNASRSKWFDRVAEGEEDQSLQENFFEDDEPKKK